MDVERVFPSLSFARMTYLTHAGDGSGRLFLVLQPGRIMVFPNDPGAAGAATFLDIRDRVSDRGNEEGLLGLAFDPGHSENGYLYVYYSAAEPRRSVISRFSVAAGGDAADPASERVLLEIPQPFSNHNGGQISLRSGRLPLRRSRGRRQGRRPVRQWAGQVDAPRLHPSHRRRLRR